MSRKTAVPRLLRPQPTHKETAEAASELDRVLWAAGLGEISPTLCDNERGPYVGLNGINAVHAAELARVVRKAMRGAFEVASDLHAAVRAHGLDDFPAPTVRNTKIHLGDVSISTADRLARTLGAPPQPELAETSDWPEAKQVMDRLDAAFKRATRGGFMDTYLHPYCQRCEGEPAITLGALKVRTARRFVTALQRGV